VTSWFEEKRRVKKIESRTKEFPLWEPEQPIHLVSFVTSWFGKKRKDERGKKSQEDRIKNQEIPPMGARAADTLGVLCDFVV